MIQNLKHLVVVPELLVAGRVLVIRLLDWDFLEHRIGQHVDAGVSLD
jgi:hypothetical protein